MAVVVLWLTKKLWWVADQLNRLIYKPLSSAIHYIADVSKSYRAMGFTLIEKTEISTEVIEYLREIEKHGGTISKRNYDHDYLNFPKDQKIEKARSECWKLDLIYKSDCGDGPMMYSITSRGKLVLEQALANFC